MVRPEIKTGSEVFIKKSNDIWYPGIVKEVIKPESCNQVSEVSLCSPSSLFFAFVVKFDLIINRFSHNFTHII